MGRKKKSEEIVFDKSSGRYWKKGKLDEYRDYQNEFIKSKYQSFVFRCDRETEQDLITFLKSQENQTAYIKTLIRNDMARRTNIIPEEQKEEKSEKDETK